MNIRRIRKRLEKGIKVTIAPVLISYIIRFLFFTMRLREHNPQNVTQFWSNGRSVIVAFWHGRLLMVPVIFMLHRDRAASGLISQHSDGEIISRSARLLGYETIRGSTSKGGLSAFRKLIRLLRDGSDIALAPDGPRGPRYRVQRGIVDLARLSGAPILPMAFSSSKKKIFKSWDAFLLPVPFSRGVFTWGKPIYVENNSKEEYIEDKRALLERELTSITNLADNYFQKDEDVPIV